MKIKLFVLFFSLLVFISCGGESADENTSDEGKSGYGENCLKTEDCKTDLKCISLVCVTNAGDIDKLFTDSSSNLM